MNNNRSSFTALMCAYLRACHSMYDEPKIFNDFLAYQLIPDEKIALIEQGLLMRLQNKNPEYASSFPDQGNCNQARDKGFEQSQYASQSFTLYRGCPGIVASSRHSSIYNPWCRIGYVCLPAT